MVVAVLRGRALALLFLRPRVQKEFVVWADGVLVCIVPWSSNVGASANPPAAKVEIAFASPIRKISVLGLAMEAFSTCFSVFTSPAGGTRPESASWTRSNFLVSPGREATVPLIPSAMTGPWLQAMFAPAGSPAPSGMTEKAPRPTSKLFSVPAHAEDVPDRQASKISGWVKDCPKDTL